MSEKQRIAKLLKENKDLTAALDVKGLIFKALSTVNNDLRVENQELVEQNKMHYDFNTGHCRILYEETELLRYERNDLKAENKLLKDEMEGRNMAASKALDNLWKEIMLDVCPDYGDWEYPGMAQNHIMIEFKDLRAFNKRLCTQLEFKDKVIDKAIRELAGG